MAGLFDMLTKTATEAATKAGAKAEELIEVNKIKSQQTDLKGELAKAKRKIGDYCFKQYEDGVELDETLTELCKEVEKLKNEITELTGQLSFQGREVQWATPENPAKRKNSFPQRRSFISFRSCMY